jgi:hypothetical protein
VFRSRFFVLNVDLVLVDRRVRFARTISASASAVVATPTTMAVSISTCGSGLE